MAVWKCVKQEGTVYSSGRRSGMKTKKLASVLALLASLFFSGMAFAQTDPGVRSSTGVNAGKPFASVTANSNDLAFFQTGLGQFNEHQTVTGNTPGLGPRFNLYSCGTCHSQPTTGETSPPLNPHTHSIAN